MRCAGVRGQRAEVPLRLSRLKGQERPHGSLRTDNKTTPMLVRRDARGFQDRCHNRGIANHKAHRCEPRPARNIRWLNAEMVGKSGRRHALHLAARRRDREAGRCRQHFALADEGREKNVMIARVLSDQHDARDRRCAIGVLLERRIPEILRMMLLADGEGCIGRAWLLCEGNRERDLDRGTVRSPALAFEANASDRAMLAERKSAASRVASSLSSSRISSPSCRNRKFRVNSPNSSEKPPPLSFSGSAQVSSSTKNPGSWSRRLCVPQGCRLRAPTVKPSHR